MSELTVERCPLLAHAPTARPRLSNCAPGATTRERNGALPSGASAELGFCPVSMPARAGMEPHTSVSGVALPKLCKKTVTKQNLSLPMLDYVGSPVKG